MLRRRIWIDVLFIGVPVTLVMLTYFFQKPEVAGHLGTEDKAIRRDRPSSVSGRRVALVIGNADYKGSLTRLRNPVNDARGMAQVLEEIGFEVISLYNANRKQIGMAVGEFGKKIGSEGVAIFYFSGHGLQVEGQNYLVPVEANIAEATDVEYECNSVNRVLDTMEARRGNRINVVILDACRNNPFGYGNKSVGSRGLAAIPDASGSLIAYAAGAGSVAKDGTGRHSPYTESLIKHIKTPNLELTSIFKAVARDVSEATDSKQKPGWYSNVSEDYYLVVSESSNLEPLPPVPGGRGRLPTDPVPERETGLEEVGRIAGEGRRFSLSNGESMEFVWVPSGTFQMGSPSSEAGRDNDEGPVHEVTISKGFYLGKYEVTQGQWEAVMGTTPWRGEYGVRSGSAYPAVYVSWNDAQEFIGRLNSAAGSEVYRLPTEAEWEYACRAGTTIRWSFGDDESQLTHYAWYIANTWYVGEHYGHRVGTLRPNAWGLYDMHGNVWEWVHDWHDEDYYSRSSLVDPWGPLTGSGRVVRGGSFFYCSARSVRSAIRNDVSPRARFCSIGFRLLRRFN